MSHAPAATFHGGARIDRYEVIDVMGAGTFGAVYRARHVHTHAMVALKVLRSAVRAQSSAWEGLLKEARITTALDHPHIVKVLDCGIAEGGTPFLAMELVDGMDLAAVLKREGRPLVAARAADLARQVLAALAAAHERGVVHRDVKPANVLVTVVRDASGTTREHARLLDFGISKMASAEWSATLPGMAMGTPGYMAPEQFSDAASADGRADLYAVAATLYQLLSGRMPYEASTLQALVSRVMTEDATPLDRVAPFVPPALAGVVQHGLARDPSRRWPTAAAFAEAIHRALALSPATQGPQAFATSPTVALESQAVAFAPTSAVDSVRWAQPSMPATSAPVGALPSTHSFATSVPSQGLHASPIAPAAPKRGPGLWVGALLGGVAIAAAVTAFAIRRDEADNAPAATQQQPSVPAPTGTQSAPFVPPQGYAPTAPYVPPAQNYPPVAPYVPPAQNYPTVAPYVLPALGALMGAPSPGSGLGPPAGALIAEGRGVSIHTINRALNVSMESLQRVAQASLAQIATCHGRGADHVDVTVTVPMGQASLIQPHFMAASPAFECVRAALDGAMQPGWSRTGTIAHLRVQFTR